MEEIGDGSGSGYGDGSGSGSGYGHGSGYGDGSGYGYGDGSSYGHGYGDGYGYYWQQALDQAYIPSLPLSARKRVATLRKSGAVIAYWRSDITGRPSNGGSGSPVQVGYVQETSGPLALCEEGTLHATYMPYKWRGERLWLVALLGETTGDDEKLGALRREIIAELPEAAVVGG